MKINEIKCDLIAPPSTSDLLYHVVEGDEGSYLLNWRTNFDIVCEEL